MIKRTSHVVEEVCVSNCMDGSSLRFKLTLLVLVGVGNSLVMPEVTESFCVTPVIELSFNSLCVRSEITPPTGAKSDVDSVSLLQPARSVSARSRKTIFFI